MGYAFGGRVLGWSQRLLLLKIISDSTKLVLEFTHSVLRPDG